MLSGNEGKTLAKRYRRKLSYGKRGKIIVFLLIRSCTLSASSQCSRNTRIIFISVFLSSSFLLNFFVSLYSVVIFPRLMSRVFSHVQLRPLVSRALPRKNTPKATRSRHDCKFFEAKTTPAATNRLLPLLQATSFPRFQSFRGNVLQNCALITLTSSGMNLLEPEETT